MGAARVAGLAAGQASTECNNQVKGQTLRRNATKQRPAPRIQIAREVWAHGERIYRVHNKTATDTKLRLTENRVSVFLCAC